MKILFLCYANSVRSQLAEAVTRSRFPEWEVASAGMRATAVNPDVLDLVRELGGDPELHYSKSVDDLDLQSFDLVVRLCAEPVVPRMPAGVREAVWELPDPGRVHAYAGTAEQFLALLRERIEERLDALAREPQQGV